MVNYLMLALAANGRGTPYIVPLALLDLCTGMLGRQADDIALCDIDTPFTSQCLMGKLDEIKVPRRADRIANRQKVTCEIVLEDRSLFDTVAGIDAHHHLPGMHPETVTLDPQVIHLSSGNGKSRNDNIKDLFDQKYNQKNTFRALPRTR
jgi:hypothetical protein